ncbi:hypothetical protein HJG60_010786 [Phyllostomus discolor]|uniref:Uncharacterized protein n=1 Tax=Phyllostomus discolor TaxID=89673 RepID=A0A834AEH7_9CHIR|nr:hypothetical protein HJG60_010786 [Phyllostomus discolor]
MDYVIVTFSSYYFSQVASDLCLLGKSAALPPPSLLPPSLPPPSLRSSDKCGSSPFSRGSVLPRIELGSRATGSRAGFETEGLLFSGCALRNFPRGQARLGHRELSPEGKGKWARNANHGSRPS